MYYICRKTDKGVHIIDTKDRVIEFVSNEVLSEYKTAGVIIKNTSKYSDILQLYYDLAKYKLSNGLKDANILASVYKRLLACIELFPKYTAPTRPYDNDLKLIFTDSAIVFIITPIPKQDEWNTPVQSTGLTQDSLMYILSLQGLFQIENPVKNSTSFAFISVKPDGKVLTVKLGSQYEYTISFQGEILNSVNLLAHYFQQQGNMKEFFSEIGRRVELRHVNDRYKTQKGV